MGKWTAAVLVSDAKEDRQCMQISIEANEALSYKELPRP
jgi:hypothetical protein